MDPQHDCHYGKTGSYEHCTWEIGTDTDKAIGVHQEVEEEALMKMFKEVIQTSKRAFDTSSHGHLILPAFSHSLKGDGIDVIGDETAMRAGCVP